MTELEMQEVADITRRFLQIRHKIRIELRPNRKRSGGFAYVWEGYIVIPGWIIDKVAEYQVAYIVHEVCHFKPGCCNHGELFKSMERDALADWGIVPEYNGSRRYAKAFNTPNMIPICDQWGNKPK